MNRRIGYHPDCVVALPLVVREWHLVCFFVPCVFGEGGCMHASLQFRADHPLASFVCGASPLAGWQNGTRIPVCKFSGLLRAFAEIGAGSTAVDLDISSYCLFSHPVVLGPPLILSLESVRA